MSKKLHIKQNNQWKPVKVIAVKEDGHWRYIKAAWIKESGQWRLFYGNNTGTETFSTPGTYSWIVPDGVYSITVTACGGGGAGGCGDRGANNNGGGDGGGGSNLITQAFDVFPGTVLTVVVGQGGIGATRDGQPGGASTISQLGFFAAGGGGGGGVSGWGGTGRGKPGRGANGARNGVAGNRFGPGIGGRTTNGGANGGDGGPYSRRGSSDGKSGQNGKMFITF